MIDEELDRFTRPGACSRFRVHRCELLRIGFIGSAEHVQRQCAWTPAEQETLPRRTLEIGFGSGLNMPYLPAEVTGIWTVEPSRVALQLAQARISASGVPVHRKTSGNFRSLAGGALPLRHALISRTKFVSNSARA